MSDLPDIIPVPKPRLRYSRATAEGSPTSRERNGVGQLPCPDVQGDTQTSSKDPETKDEVSVEDSPHPTAPPYEPAVTANCSEGDLCPESVSLSTSSVSDSVSSDDSHMIPDSLNSLDLHKDLLNADKKSFTDQVIDVQGGVEIHEVSKSQSLQSKPERPKKPRAATIRVSRKKQTLSGSRNRSDISECVTQSSWLDVWKGRKHIVLWTSLDGHLMSMWKKRTDKFTEYVFHVTSITNIRKQDHGRFTIFLQKKHFEFMAHSEAVHKAWLDALYATRGRETIATPKRHGPLVMKDPRKKVYVAICGYSLWIYSSKEDFSLGLGMMCVSMNIASVKSTSRHGFSLITPYRTFNFSADSAKEAAAWLESLNDVIRSALSYSEVAQRLWSSPCNKVCADCGAANPEWASVNLLVVICEACAGAHRSMGSNRSKVRGLKLDNKVWTEPLIQLFLLYGNKAPNKVWGHNIPPIEQIRPDVPPDQRSEFIFAKYQRGLYRKAHPLASSRKLLDQRLREVVCGPNVEETLSLLCSGARVSRSTDGDLHSAITVAESSGQSLQAEILRHNEFVEPPDFEQTQHSEEQMEELHGKLDDERFLFSQENQSAACDVLDLTEVLSVFDCSVGQTHEFEVLTLTDRLICSADDQDALLNHMLHIMKVVLAGAVMDDDLLGVWAVSRASLREGADLQCVDVWCTLQPGEMTIHTKQDGSRDTVVLDARTRCHLQRPEKCVLLEFGERTLHMQFELEHSCVRWCELVQRAMCSTTDGRHCAGSVPCAVDHCISHITQYGLKVEGLYRRCGITPQINKLVETLHVSPRETVLETDELSILDVSGALKKILRDIELIPNTHAQLWIKAAALSDKEVRVQMYRKLLKQLPPDNRATLTALCGHLHIVQMHSSVNRMTAHNLAVIFVVTLFQDLAMKPNMVQLTRELIAHHTEIFTSPVETEGEMVTVL